MGHFHTLTDADWALIKQYLVENEKLFGIRVDDLLTHNRTKLAPGQIYRKVGEMKPAEALTVIAADAGLRRWSAAMRGACRLFWHPGDLLGGGSRLNLDFGLLQRDNSREIQAFTIVGGLAAGSSDSRLGREFLWAIGEWGAERGMPR